jgi:hypothetical protein
MIFKWFVWRYDPEQNGTNQMTISKLVLVTFDRTIDQTCRLILIIVILLRVILLHVILLSVM